MANINRSFIFTEENKVRGMLVPQRSENSVIEHNAVRSPFISMVTVKDPLGFNPVHKPVIIKRKKNDNEVYNKNRKLIKLLQEKGSKKKSNEAMILSPICEPLKMNKTQSMKYLKPIIHLKQNKDEPVKESESLPEPKSKDTIKIKAKNQITNSTYTNTNTPKAKEAIKEIKVEKQEERKPQVIPAKSNAQDNILLVTNSKEEFQDDKVSKIKNEEDEKPNTITIKEPKLIQEDPLLTEENIDEEEMNKILGYINNLDYEKYARDLEIREALQLIKNKMDQENKDEDDGDDNKQKHQSQPCLVDQNIKQDKDSIKQNEEDKSETKLPEIKNQIINKQEEEKNEEIKKYQLAEQISKCDPKIRAIHSYQSIKKLLEREGINDTKLIDPLRITLIREKCLAKDDDYIPNKLPFLHSLPLI